MKAESVHESYFFGGNVIKGLKEFKRLTPRLQESLITNEYIRQYCNKRYPVSKVFAEKTDLASYLKTKMNINRIFARIRTFFEK